MNGAAVSFHAPLPDTKYIFAEQENSNIKKERALRAKSNENCALFLMLRGLRKMSLFACFLETV